MTDKRKLVLTFLITALLGGGFLWFYHTPTAQPGHALLVTEQAPQGGDFTLSGVQGETHLHDFAGKIVLLYFGYTTCPDICPTNLGNLAYAMKLLNEQELTQVQVLMISVDPARDTLDKLTSYLGYFHPAFQGLSGSEEAIAQVARQYGAVYQKVSIDGSALGYSVDHSAFTYLIDQQGKLIRQLPHATTGEEFVAAIRSLTHDNPALRGAH